MKIKTMVELKQNGEGKPLLVAENHSIENIGAFLHIITTMYKKEHVRELLIDIITEYSQFVIDKLSRQGYCHEPGLEAIERIDLLKLLADALKDIQVQPMESKILT
jgi:hypothetical protein